MFNLFRNKPKNKTLPLLVDIHSHLLPGLDDGVKSVEETVYILKILQNLGYKKIITTPHVMSDHYPNTEEGIVSKLEETIDLLSEHKLNIKLEVAAEYYLDENLISKLSKQEKLLTFGKNYLLFETSFFNKPAFLEEAVFTMNTQGYQPILAHPERYSYLQGSQKLLEKLKDMNLLFQMNILSLTGFYSLEVKKFARQLQKANLIDFVGTDCHNALQAEEILKRMNNRDIKFFSSQNILNQSLL
ncbi:MAG: capsular biosynthesis protein [Cyclobacteriaceae bacterium]|nr:capsular biosynthesis protein [Cyclobacteriaceae bacterium]